MVSLIIARVGRGGREDDEYEEGNHERMGAPLAYKIVAKLPIML